MNQVERPLEPSLERLARAVEKWVAGGDPGGLSRWLARELDQDGVPIRLSPGDWPDALELLARARSSGGWPPGCGEAIDAMVTSALRFSRPDGRVVLSGGEAWGWSSSGWRDWYRGTAIGRVLGWWSGNKGRNEGVIPPPLPTWSADRRALAILRPNWLPEGDLLAVDHVAAARVCRLELVGGGRTWLAGNWEAGAIGGAGPSTSTRPRLLRRIHTSAADLVEWSHRDGPARVTRSVLLLRGRAMAVIAVMVDGGGASMKIETPADLTTALIRGTRALGLASRPRRGSAQAIPMALPCRDYETDRGTVRGREGSIELTATAGGRRNWLPLLVSWDAERNRKPPEWRILTISEKSKRIGADRAFAVRMSWGPEETFVIYRSLGPPARRTFLGHQTSASFLFAAFNQDGDLTPILSVD